jgi:DNA-binding transcriptional LysR family regulator
MTTVTMLIDLAQLRTFVAVAEEQHLTRAAERLHISQSAASAHVRAVEEALDNQLFVRTNRNLELTPAGELLLRKARLLLNEAVLFSAFARELRGKTQGQLVVGSSSDLSANRLGEVISELRTLNPLVNVDLRVRPSSGTRQGLKSGELDVGVLLDRPTDAALVYHELTTVQFSVVGPAAWKERIDGADWDTLASLPWVTPSDSGMAYSAILQELFGARGLVVNSVIAFDNATFARAMVQGGAGLTLVRREHAVEGERAGQMAVSPLVHAEYPLCIAYLASRRADPLVRAFVEAAAQVWPMMRVISSTSALRAG